MAKPIRVSTSNILLDDAKSAATGIERAIKSLRQVKVDVDSEDALFEISMLPNAKAELQSVLSAIEQEKEKIDLLTSALSNGTQKIEDADAGFKNDPGAEKAEDKLQTLFEGVCSQTLYALFGSGCWLYSLFSENGCLQTLWTEAKEVRKATDLAEDITEILSEDFGDKPEFTSVIGDLSKIEKMFKVLDDPASSDNWIDAVEAFLKLFCDLKNRVSAGMGGISGTEAGLVIDLITSEAKNLLENAAESKEIIREQMNAPDATIADYLKTASYIGYNMGEGVLVEGFCDVVLDKADIVGHITGMSDYVKTASEGQYSKVSEVYYDFVDLYESNVEAFGTKKAIGIYADAFAESIKDSVSTWIAPVAGLFAK